MPKSAIQWCEEEKRGGGRTALDSKERGKKEIQHVEFIWILIPTNQMCKGTF